MDSTSLAPFQLSKESSASDESRADNSGRDAGPVAGRSTEALDSIMGAQPHRIINRSLALASAFFATSTWAHGGEGGVLLLTIAMYIAGLLFIINIVAALKLRASLLVQLAAAFGMPIISCALGFAVFYVDGNILHPGVGSGPDILPAVLAVVALPVVVLIAFVVQQKREERRWRAEAARRSAVPPAGGWAQ